ncbi:MAG: carboxypeptidase-like regulatory domain-containing protein [Balneolaceae bacterium]
MQIFSQRKYLIITFYIMCNIFLVSCNLVGNSDEISYTVSGTVGIMIEQDVKPLENATVIISNKKDTTDELGLYNISEIKKGTYTVAILYKNLDTMFVSLSVEGEHEKINRDLFVSPNIEGNRTLEGRTVVRINNTFGAITGVPDVKVDIYELINEYKIFTQTVTTGEDGYFRLENLTTEKKEFVYTQELIVDEIVEIDPNNLEFGGEAHEFGNVCGENCSIMKNTELEPNEIRDEYISLEVNNSWQYDYHLSSNRPNTVDIYSGKAVWTVTKVDNEESKKTYWIEEILNGEYTIQGDGCSGHDSFEKKEIPIENDTLIFTIDEFENGELNFNFQFREQACSSLEYYYRNYSNGLDLKRFYSPLFEEEIEIRDWGEHLMVDAIIVKDLGIKRLEIRNTPSNSGAYFLIELEN